MRTQLVCIIAAIAILACAPWVLPNYQLHTLTTAGLFVMLSSGLNLIHGFVGRLSLGHTAFYGLGGYAAGLIAVKGGGLLLTLPAAIVVTVLAGLAIGRVTLRFRGAHFVLVTLAFAAILHLLANNLVDLTGGPMGLSGIATPLLHQAAGDWRLFGSKASFYWLVLALDVIAVYIVWRIVHSPLGDAMIAIREDENLAEAVGIDEYKYSMLAFVTGAAMAGVAGAVYAHYVSFISPEIFHFNIMIMILVMVILGGVGTISGPIIGSVLVVILLEALRLHESLREPIFGAVLVGATLLFPQGLVPLIAAKLRRARGGAAAGDAPAGDDPVAGTGLATQASMQGSSTMQGAIPAAAAGAMPAAPAVAEPAAVPVAASDAVSASGAVSASDAVSAAPPRALLAIDGLTVRFGGLVAVDDVRFEVPAGRIVSLIGPNGAGKTTTLNLITGFVERSAGRIVFDGVELPRRFRPSEIAARGMIRTFQTTRGLLDVPIGKAVEIGLHRTLGLGWRRIARAFVAPLPDMQRAGRAAAILRRVGLRRDPAELTRNLSYGEQRLLEVAIALAAEPKLLVLDEPAAGMNPEETARMMALIRSVRDSGVTVLLVEHDMKLVMGLSDHIVVLDHGKRIAEGNTTQIQNDPTVIEAYLGRSAQHAAA
ncbi:MAG: ATP-binding cassette domain-containing protein [Burkholderiaceae bacterium]